MNWIKRIGKLLIHLLCAGMAGYLTFVFGMCLYNLVFNNLKLAFGDIIIGIFIVPVLIVLCFTCAIGGSVILKISIEHFIKGNIIK